MPTPVYATLDQFKRWLKSDPGDPANTLDDTELTELLDAASRDVDADTGRRFYASDPEPRYFTPDPSGGALVIDEALTVTGVAFDAGGLRAWDTALAVTDYWLHQQAGVPGVTPYVGIALDPVQGRYGWPAYPRGVKVTGTWGATATGEHPGPIRTATLLRAARLFGRKATQLGVQTIFDPQSGASSAVTLKGDVDYAMAIERYKRRSWVFA